MKKALIAVGVLAMLALGALVGWRVYQKLAETGKDPRSRGAPPVAVEVAPIRRATLRDVGAFTGSLAPQSQFIVAPRVAARLEKLRVNLGDPVRSGQIIAEIDDSEYFQQAERAKAELLVAQASVQESRAALEAAGREYERAKTLLEKKIASESAFDQAKAQYEAQQARQRVADAQVNQKQAALKEAEIRLSYTKIAATWEGGPETRVVGERFVDEGALLTANAPIVSILDISSLTAVVYVIERDYSKIGVGQEAKASTDAFPGRTFTGRIIRIAPQLQETSRQARVEISVPNPEGLLKPGMFVRVELEFASRADALALPAAALVRRDGQRGVFVADGASKTARFVPVETGIASGDLVELLSPQIDAPVVVMGQHLLGDEAPIHIVQADSAPAGKAATGPAGAPGAPAARSQPAEVRP